MTALLISFGLFIAYLVLDKVLDIWSGKVTLDYQLRQQELQHEAELIKHSTSKPTKIEGFAAHTVEEELPEPEEPIED